MAPSPTPSTSPLVPDPAYAVPASTERIARTVTALARRGIDAVAVETRSQALETLLARLPEKGSIFTTTSATVEALGVPEALVASGRFELVRPAIARLDRATQGAQIRALVQGADAVVGSVHAVTEDGVLLAASASGSQLGLYADSGMRVVWLVGSQKIVPSVEEGWRRIERYSYPLEDARARRVIGVPSSISKVLTIAGERRPHRASLILLSEAVGF